MPRPKVNTDRFFPVTGEFCSSSTSISTTSFTHKNDRYIAFKEAVTDIEQIFYTTESQKISYMENLLASTFSFSKPNIKYQLLHSLIDGSRNLCIKVDHRSYDGTLLRIFDDQFTAIAAGQDDTSPVHSFKQYIDWIQTVDQHSEALQ